jgi:drug/metabolite transporter (DMT)-like permease
VEWGLLAAIASIWGSSFLWIEVGLEAMRPTVVTLLRVALGTLAIAVVPAARRTGIKRDDWPRVVFVGVLWVGVPFLLFPIAQRYVDSAFAGMMNGSVPLFAAVVAVVLLRSWPGRVQIVGLLVGFLGVIAIAWPQLRGADASVAGVLLLLAAVVCYGIATNLAVPLQQQYGALPVLFRALCVALLFDLPFGLAGLPGSHLEARPLAAMVPLGLLGTGWAFVGLATLVGRAGATRGTVAIYFTPIVAIVLGVVFRDEHVAALSIAGAALVIAGAWLTSRRERLPIAS